MNYKRKISLIVGDESGSGLDLSGFRVSFEIEKNATENPNTAKISIWNLSKSTASKIEDGTLKRIVLSAGYESNSATIFDGNITSTAQVRNGADTILSIEAGDGVNGYAYALSNATIGAGYSNSDLAKKAFEPMKENGVKDDANTKALDKDTKFPRGRALFGASRNYARASAKNSGAQWSIQDGHLIFCNERKTLDENEAFLLNKTSGLVGSPKKDKDGVTAQCLLNANIKIYDPVKIESEFLTGEFKTLSVRHLGDTHSNSWITEIKCCALDASTKKTTK